MEEMLMGVQRSFCWWCQKGQAVIRGKKRGNTKTCSSGVFLKVFMYLEEHKLYWEISTSKAVGPFAFCDSSQEFAARNNMCIDGLVLEL